jgi:uridine kinase
MSKPVIIGVAGGSGSGKTTVVRKILDGIGDGQVSVIDHDRYYLDHPDLRFEDRAGLNFDHPSALDTELLAEHVRVLRSGAPVDIPVYDFRRHVRQPETQTIPVRPAIIVEGILVFENAALRELMDVKVFVDADDDTRFIRRMQRDMRERGRTLAQVIDQWQETVKPMHLEFIEPTKRYADIIVPQGGHNDVAIGMLLSLIRGLTSV